MLIIEEIKSLSSSSFYLISMLNEGELKGLFHVSSCARQWEKLLFMIILFGSL